MNLPHLTSNLEMGRTTLTERILKASGQLASACSRVECEVHDWTLTYLGGWKCMHCGKPKPKNAEVSRPDQES